MASRRAGGHGGDVARVDPRHRLVQRPDRGQAPGAQAVEVQEQVRHEVAAAQVQERGAGLVARGVEPLLDAGEAVDEARAVAQLGADAALEHHAGDPVLPHRRGEAVAGAFGVGDRHGSAYPHRRGPSLDGVRIASLLPAATEIVVALGLAERLVAVTFECSQRGRCPVVVDTALPADLAPAEIDAWVRDRAARGLPLYELDRAALAAAAPDLVLTQDLCRVCALPAATVAEACRVIGIDAEVLSVDPHSLDDVLHSVDAIGRAAGAAAVAAELTASLRARLAAVERAVAGRPRPRVLVLEWTDPPYLAGHWVPELVQRAGGQPVAAAPGERSVAAEWADLPAADVVVVAPCGQGLDDAVAQCAPSPHGCPGCRSWRSTRRATSCRRAPRWSTGSRRWRGRCTPTPCRPHRPAESPLAPGDPYARCARQSGPLSSSAGSRSQRREAP